MTSVQDSQNPVAKNSSPQAQFLCPADLQAHTNFQTHTHTNKQTNEQTDKHTNQPTYTHTNKQTNKQTNTKTRKHKNTNTNKRQTKAAHHAVHIHAKCRSSFTNARKYFQTPAFIFNVNEIVQCCFVTVGDLKMLDV